MLDGFPASTRQSKKYVWPLAAVEQWEHGRDLAQEFSDAATDCYLRGRITQRTRKPVEPTPCDEATVLRQQFLRGQFLPPAQQQALAFKKLAARHAPPPPPIRVRIASDWFDEIDED